MVWRPVGRRFLNQHARHGAPARDHVAVPRATAAPGSRSQRQITLPPLSTKSPFLDEDLTAAESRAVPPTWTLTAHHRPMFDSDPQEGSNLTVRAAWHAIMQKHHVDLDFNGHAHHYESTLPIGGDGGVVDAGGIRFITAGGAGALFDSPDATPNPWTLVYYVGLSFAVVDVAGRTLTLQGRRLDGTSIETSPIVLTK